MKKALSLLLLISFMAMIVFSGGCTAPGPGDLLYNDELYGDNPADNPDEHGDGVQGDPEEIPDYDEIIPVDLEIPGDGEE